ncbi:MAG: tRNA pseudouridine(38-40) synthase TruA [Desulfobacterales bacterium]|nr:MAG: tRNA pseudouridine(38-40) synthase TruA [Desulfobacterales bacterium]
MKNRLQNFKLTIEYDGSRYHGWQRQRDARTIQGEIEAGLKTMTGKAVTLIGSGRTDAGVHACGQVANFHSVTTLKPEVFQKGLNSLLPDDIVIRHCVGVPQEFHARYDAKSKTYHYKILNRPLPAAIGRQYAWWIRQKLDLQNMRSALAHLLGSHDFKAFEGSGSPRADTTRYVIRADLVEKKRGILIFQIEANGFLRFMVRNIVGTLVSVGRGKLTSDDFGRILDSKDRSQAGATAPALGLFLMEVRY